MCSCALQILELDEKQFDLLLNAVVAFVVLDVVDILLQVSRACVSLITQVQGGLSVQQQPLVDVKL